MESPSNTNYTTESLPLLLTTKQVCGELAVSPVTLWRLIKAGQIKSIRVGRRSVRIPREELISILDRAKAEQIERNVVGGRKVSR